MSAGNGGGGGGGDDDYDHDDDVSDPSYTLTSADTRDSILAGRSASLKGGGWGVIVVILMTLGTPVTP